MARQNHADMTPPTEIKVPHTLMKVGINLGFFLMGSRDPNPYSYNVKVPWGGVERVFFYIFT